MALPNLTHLQALVLQVLGSEERWGREVRDELMSNGEKTSTPAFYQLMSRMESAKFVRGWYETKVVEGQTIKQRKYRVTPNGRRALEQAVNFYRVSATAVGIAFA